jgi:hypothetical protein
MRANPLEVISTKDAPHQVKEYTEIFSHMNEETDSSTSWNAALLNYKEQTFQVADGCIFQKDL